MPTFDWFRDFISNEQQTILDESNEILMIKSHKIKPQEYSNLARLFSNVVSSNTLKVAHERYFPYYGIPSSKRKIDDLKEFKQLSNSSLFNCLNYLPLAGTLVSACSSMYISRHFQKNFQVRSARGPIYITSIGFGAIFSYGSLRFLGFDYYARFGLPSCFECHAFNAAASVAIFSSVYPIVTASLMSIHASHLTSTKVVPIDIYSSKTSFLKALSLAKDISLRGRFLPIITVTTITSALATYFAVFQQYDEFIKLFSLVCHSIDNPNLNSFTNRSLPPPLSSKSES